MRETGDSGQCGSTRNGEKWLGVGMFRKKSQQEFLTLVGCVIEKKRSQADSKIFFYEKLGGRMAVPLKQRQDQ